MNETAEACRHTRRVGRKSVDGYGNPEYTGCGCSFSVAIRPEIRHAAEGLTAGEIVRKHRHMLRGRCFT